jgi:hypothetical protein
MTLDHAHCHKGWSDGPIKRFDWSLIGPRLRRVGLVRWSSLFSVNYKGVNIKYTRICIGKEQCPPKGPLYWTNPWGSRRGPIQGGIEPGLDQLDQVGIGCGWWKRWGDARRS